MLPISSNGDEYHKCTDSQGKIVFSNVKCPDGSKGKVTRKLKDISDEELARHQKKEELTRKREESAREKEKLAREREEELDSEREKWFQAKKRQIRDETEQTIEMIEQGYSPEEIHRLKRQQEEDEIRRRTLQKSRNE
jgi:hypothetical protein